MVLDKENVNIIFYEFHCCGFKIAELSAFSGVPERTKCVETVVPSLHSFYINLFCIKLIY